MGIFRAEVGADLKSETRCNVDPVADRAKKIVAAVLYETL